MSGFSQQYQYEQAERRELLSSIHVAAVAKVLSFDPTAMTVDVLPLSQRLTGGEYATPSLIQGVPVAGTRGGGFLYRPWFQKDDVGLLLYLDHDADLVLQQGAPCRPNTERSHSDSDPVFLGGIVAGGWRSQGLPEGLVLAEETGNCYIAITKNGIQVKGDIRVEGDVTADSISLKSHTHPDVAAGSNTTGKPQ